MQNSLFSKCSQSRIHEEQINFWLKRECAFPFKFGNIDESVSFGVSFFTIVTLNQESPKLSYIIGEKLNIL